MIDKVIKKTDCTGCKMCGDICPKEAIGFEIDEEGFWHPKVTSEKCANCCICVNHCPVINPVTNKNAKAPDVYATWIKDEIIRVKSTSGGLYYALAETALDDNAFIAGCVFADDWKSAKHIIGNTYDDLDKIFRSKYFQSDTAGVYKDVKRILSDRKKVLFSGTPCQNAALSAYLGKDYENLIQCDFICRGINSPKAHLAHVRELEKKYKSQVEFFNFKNKEQGWIALGNFVKFKNGKSDFTDRHTSAWIRGYVGSNLYMRFSCENCKFKKLPRVSDISLGDFWGFESDAENMKKGISVVMINTQKGADFYKKTFPLIYSEPSSLNIAITGNPCILYPPAKFDLEKRKEFFRRIENEDFSDVVFDL